MLNYDLMTCGRVRGPGAWLGGLWPFVVGLIGGGNAFGGVSSLKVKESIPQIFAEMTDYKLCSGPMVDEWRDEETGEHFKMEWQRSYIFRRSLDAPTAPEFTVRYRYRRQSQLYARTLESGWRRVGSIVDYEIGIHLHFVWNEALDRYVGWSQGVMRADMYPKEIFLKFHGLTLDEDGLRLQYAELLPLNPSKELQLTWALYDERLRIKNRSLENHWTYEIWSLDRENFSPSARIGGNEGVRHDSLESCGLF